MYLLQVAFISLTRKSLAKKTLFILRSEYSSYFDTHNGAYAGLSLAWRLLFSFVICSSKQILFYYHSLQGKSLLRSAKQMFISHTLRWKCLLLEAGAYLARSKVDPRLLYSTRQMLISYIPQMQMLISHTYPSLYWPYFQRGRPCILYICIYAPHCWPFDGFLLQLVLEGAYSLPRGACVTRINLKTHAWSRGPDSLL